MQPRWRDCRKACRRSARPDRGSRRSATAAPACWCRRRRRRGPEATRRRAAGRAGTKAGGAGLRSRPAGKARQADMTALLSVEHLEVRFGATPVVDDVSFEIAAGEKFALVG